MTEKEDKVRTEILVSNIEYQAVENLPTNVMESSLGQNVLRFSFNGLLVYSFYEPL